MLKHLTPDFIPPSLWLSKVLVDSVEQEASGASSNDEDGPQPMATDDDHKDDDDIPLAVRYEKLQRQRQHQSLR